MVQVPRVGLEAEPIGPLLHGSDCERIRRDHLRSINLFASLLKDACVDKILDVFCWAEVLVSRVIDHAIVLVNCKNSCATRPRPGDSDVLNRDHDGLQLVEHLNCMDSVHWEVGLVSNSFYLALQLYILTC